MKKCPECGADLPYETYCTECDTFIEESAFGSPDRPSLLASLLDNLFPWFWPSALKASPQRENDFVKLLRDATPWEASARKGVRAMRWMLVLTVILAVAPFLVMFMLMRPLASYGTIGFFLIPVVSTIFGFKGDFTRVSELVPWKLLNCVDLAGQAQIPPEDVLWGLSRKGEERVKYPIIARRWALVLLLGLTLAAGILMFVLSRLPNVREVAGFGVLFAIQISFVVMAALASTTIGLYAGKPSFSLIVVPVANLILGGLLFVFSGTFLNGPGIPAVPLISLPPVCLAIQWASAALQERLLMKEIRQRMGLDQN